MRVESNVPAGEVICPVTSFVVEKAGVRLADEELLAHHDDFNATIIRNFLIAVKDLGEGDEVRVNLNLLMYAPPSADAASKVPGLGGLGSLADDQQKLKLYTYADETVRMSALAAGYIPRGLDFVSPHNSGVVVAVDHSVLPTSARAMPLPLVVVATRYFAIGEEVFSSTGITLPFPVRSTVALPGDKHLRLTGETEFLWHSCQPNVSIEICGETIRGRALRHINANERLTYNYLTTEWEIAVPFQCCCRAAECYGFIRGFRYLDSEQQKLLLPSASPAVVEKYEKPLPPCATLAYFNESSLVAPAARGVIAAQKHLSAGTILFNVRRYQVNARELVVDAIRIPHCCDANTAFLQGRLVTTRALVPGEALTFDLCTLLYELPLPFHCNCLSIHCRGSVSGFGPLTLEEKNRVLLVTDPAVRAEAVSKGFTVRSASPLVDIKPNGSMGQATFAATSIKKGQHFFQVKGLVLPFPTVYTIFLGAQKHLLFADGAECLAHSCDPNVRVLVDPVNGSLECVALRDIRVGEVISFNYNTTEWDMSTPFFCVCGSSTCSGVVKGFAHLPEAQQQLLWHAATPAIRALSTSNRRSVLASLDKMMVGIRDSGELFVVDDTPSGVVLFKGSSFQVSGRVVTIEDAVIRHSCDPTAVWLDGNVVLCRSVCMGDEVTLNINQLLCLTNECLVCTCGTHNCVGRIAGFGRLSADEQEALLLATDPAARMEALQHGYLVRSSSPLVEIKSNGDVGQATFAARHITKGTRFFSVTGLVIPFPTMYTILLDVDRHLLFAGGAQCLAHSCDPNVRVIVDRSAARIECLALRDIEPGALISFNYLTTEWDMSSPFMCLCGSASCAKQIRGFAHLADADRQRLWASATPAIRALAARDADRDGVKNLPKLAAGRLYVDANGVVRARCDMSPGTAVLDAVRSHVSGSRGMLFAEELGLRHQCNATAALIEKQIILISQVNAGDELTVNLNCLAYELHSSFACHCSKYGGAVHEVSGFKGLGALERNEVMIFTQPDVRATAAREGYKILSSCSLVDVRPNGDMGQATFATKNIPTGTRFFAVTGLCLPFPTVYTILAEENRHLLFAGGAQCLAHSCDPNLQISIDPLNSSLECIALRDIDFGELLSFNYNTTEWDMNTPFRCVCGSPRCTHNIKGFKYLSAAQRRELEHLITPAIRCLMNLQHQVPLPPTLTVKEANGMLFASQPVAEGTVLFECPHLDIQPTQITIAGKYTIKHRSHAYHNTVVVEGCIVASRDLAAGEVLTVNMCYFVYDMTVQFPNAYSDECKGFRFLDEAIKQKYLYLCEPPVRAQAMRDGWTVVSTSPLLHVRPNGDMGQTAYANGFIPVGTVLFHATGLLVPFPTMYTICVGPKKHLLFGDAAECIAHHCDPNVMVVVNSDGTFDFVTVKPIEKNEMVTFNYNTTEWDMSTPFACLCGSPRCTGTINGFRYLSDADRQRLWPITSDYVKSLSLQERRNPAGTPQALK